MRIFRFLGGSQAFQDCAGQIIGKSDKALKRLFIDETHNTSTFFVVKHNFSISFRVLLDFAHLADSLFSILMRDIKQYYTGFLILFRLFDGDVNRWIDWILKNGSDEQKQDDLPVAFQIKEEAEKDSSFLERARIMIDETAGKR